MGEDEKKVEKKKLKLVITIPTKETIIETLTGLFPGIKVEVEEAEKPSESVTEESTTE